MGSEKELDVFVGFIRIIWVLVLPSVLFSFPLWPQDEARRMLHAHPLASETPAPPLVPPPVSKVLFSFTTDVRKIDSL